MHIVMSLSMVLLGYALESTDKDVSSNLISKEGSILSTMMNKTEDNAQGKNEVSDGNNASMAKEPSSGVSNKKNDTSSGEKDKDTKQRSSLSQGEANPKVAKNGSSSASTESNRDGSSLISKAGLLSGHSKESTIHIIRLSEDSKPSVVKDSSLDTTKGSLSIIKDAKLTEKKSALADLANSAIESRDSSNMRNELHETSTSLI